MIVVKIGGATGVSLVNICEDVAEMIQQNNTLILVHGGSAETNEISEKFGHPPRMITSVSGFTSRYTDRKTLEYFVMATNGKVNTFLVESLQKIGVNAFGLSGLDGRLMVAKRKKALRIAENGRQRIIRDDYTGQIVKINTSLLKTIIDMGFTPVIAPLAISQENDALNVDADRAAAMIAGAMGAEQLLLLSNVPGLLQVPNDESSLITNIKRGEIESAMSVAEKRMKKKVMGAREALEMGVSKVVIADGRMQNPIFNALDGRGTVIY